MDQQDLEDLIGIIKMAKKYHSGHWRSVGTSSHRNHLFEGKLELAAEGKVLADTLPFEIHFILDRETREVRWRAFHGGWGADVLQDALAAHRDACMRAHRNFGAHIEGFTARVTHST
jgi:hypothetical protein